MSPTEGSVFDYAPAANQASGIHWSNPCRTSGFQQALNTFGAFSKGVVDFATGFNDGFRSSVLLAYDPNYVPTDSQFYNGGRVTGDVAAGILGIAEIFGGSGLGGGGLAACGSGGGCTLGGPAILAGNDLIAHGILVTGSGAINLGRDLTNFFAQENEGPLQSKNQDPNGNMVGGKSLTDIQRVNYPEGISFDKDIANNLTKFDGFSQKDGISGTHNLDEFTKVALDKGVKITEQKDGLVNGIKQIEYKIPAYDRYGNVTGYKSETFRKTVYDPKLFSDQKILDLGQQAAAKGYSQAISNGFREYTAEAGGIQFRVYLDGKTGAVTNFFPKVK
jgi:Bacterial EndoU nuclease